MAENIKEYKGLSGFFADLNLAGKHAKASHAMPVHTATAHFLGTH